MTTLFFTESQLTPSPYVTFPDGAHKEVSCAKDIVDALIAGERYEQDHYTSYHKAMVKPAYYGGHVLTIQGVDLLYSENGEITFAGGDFPESSPLFLAIYEEIIKR